MIIYMMIIYMYSIWCADDHLYIMGYHAMLADINTAQFYQRP